MKIYIAVVKTILCSLVFSLLIINPAEAEVKTINPEKKAAIRKLIELTGLKEVVILSADSAVDRIFPILKKAIAKDNQAVTEAVLAIMKTTTISLVKRQISSQGGLVDRVIPIYDRHYTHNEIRGLIKFYESPLGKKMASVRPEITKEGIVVAEQWVRYLEPLLIQAIEKSLEKEGYVVIKKEHK
jgi:hypothetical protein